MKYLLLTIGLIQSVYSFGQVDELKASFAGQTNGEFSKGNLPLLKGLELPNDIEFIDGQIGIVKSGDTIVFNLSSTTFPKNLQEVFLTLDSGDSFYSEFVIVQKDDMGHKLKPQVFTVVD